MAGAVGRVGEALLNEVLARGGYDAVYALADLPMSLGVRGLSLTTLDALPALADVFVALSDPDDTDARSFYGRDAAFTPVSVANVARIAECAAAAGARRLALVHPLPAWQQMSRFHGGLVGEAELAIAGLPLDSVVVLRPVASSRLPVGNWLQRVANVYLSLQLLMVPRSIPTVTSADLARVTVAVLRDARPGVHVLGAAQIDERARRPAPDTGVRPALPREG